jgi:hypothetical protein
LDEPFDLANLTPEAAQQILVDNITDVQIAEIKHAMVTGLAHEQDKARFVNAALGIFGMVGKLLV